MIAKLQQFKPLPQIAAMSAEIESHAVLQIACCWFHFREGPVCWGWLLLEAQNLKHQGADLCRPASLFQLPGQDQLNCCFRAVASPRESGCRLPLRHDHQSGCFQLGALAMCLPTRTHTHTQMFHVLQCRDRQHRNKQTTPHN